MARSLSNNRSNWLTLRLLAGTGLAALALGAAALPPAAAQTLNDRLAARARQEPSRMLVDAREIQYDRDRDRVSAIGNVQIYYQGRVLEADRVTYDRKTKRVFAQGNARLTETDGTKTFGDRFELTDDFKDGFIDSLRVTTAENTRLSAARGERTGGEQTVLDKATYTACEACKEAPEKPPLWQVKAARIIHNNSEQRIYYENASLEFWGVPVAWFPFFSSPDPSVRRQSGVLAPRFINKTRLGTGVSVPLYWAIAPNYDLTFTPTYLSRQGFFGDLLFRHRLAHGSYNIRVNGIFQQNPGAFPIQPYAGAGAKEFRGSIESRGKFYLNEKWTFGWDAAFATDKHYFTDYKIKPSTLSTLFLTESISQVYLRGRGERSWFDVSAYRFQGLHVTDWQKQIETVTPAYDFDRRFTPSTIGGELRISANGALIKRDAAVFQPIPIAGQNTTPVGFLYDGAAGGLYQPCRYTLNGAVVGAYAPGQCLLRGFAGEYARNTVDVAWRRRLIDPLGQEWTPFFGFRADLAWLSVNTGALNAPNAAQQGFVGPGYGNVNQGNFFGGDADNFTFRGMPTAGLEYRYPFFAQTSLGLHHVEPIAQLVLRPNETRIGKLPNEDAQSLVFDETSIFALNKFSGYDRIEGGTRLNYGARYSFTGRDSLYASLLLGQSLQLSGRNSFAAFDLANTGRSSGLESRASDFVAAATIQPTARASVTARGRFDEKDFGLRRLDIDATANVGPVNFRGIYSRIAPQRDLGYALRREGLYLESTVKLPNNFYITGGTLFDMDRYLSDRAFVATNGGSYRNTPWRVAAATLGIGYRDECTDFSLVYTRSIDDQLATRGLPNRSSSAYIMRLELRELGEAQLSRRDQN